MKNRKCAKHRFLVLMLTGMMACTACKMEGKDMNQTRDWSANELAMLEAVGADSERIEKNELFQGERRMLEALAQAENYLQARYPDETMRFVEVNNSLPGAKTYSFRVISSAAAEEIFIVRVNVEMDEPETFDIWDSRFSAVKKAELQALVQDVLQELQIPAVCEMEITGGYGVEYDPSRPLKETLASGLLVNVFGKIYVEQSAAPEDIEQLLGGALRGQGLCSGVMLVLVKDGAMQEAAALPLLDNPYVVSSQTVLLPANAVTEVD